MAVQEFFYPEPPTQQGRRFAPIPAQGQQPPSWSVAPIMALALTSWPSGLEYDVPRPITVAPLTLKYGPVPPKYSTVNFNSIISLWPCGLEYEPPQRRALIAPMTLNYGNQPPIQSRPTFLYPELEIPLQQRRVQTPIPPPVPISQVNQYSVISTWAPEPPPIQRLPSLVMSGGQAAPPSYSISSLTLAVSNWPSGLEYDPQQRPLRVAPLTLVYGNTPPSKSSPQTRFVEPEIPPQRLIQLAPLTLVYGNQPPTTRVRPAWVSETEPLPQQRQPTYTLLASVPFSISSQRAIYLTWVAPDVLIQRLPVSIPIPAPVIAPPVPRADQAFAIPSWFIEPLMPRRAVAQIVSGFAPPPPPSTPRIVAFIYGKPNATVIIYGMD